MPSTRSITKKSKYRGSVSTKKGSRYARLPQSSPGTSEAETTDNDKSRKIKRKDIVLDVESSTETDNKTSQKRIRPPNEAANKTPNGEFGGFHSLHLYKPKEPLNENEEQREFFDKIEGNDISGLPSLLFKQDGQVNEHIEINQPGLNGYTALQLAIQREHEELIKLLLSVNTIKIQDALFHAIKEKNLSIIETILNHVIYKPIGKTTVPTLTKDDFVKAIEFCNDEKNKMESSEFDKDITPLMLAAQMNSYELIEYFGTYCKPLDEVDTIMETYRKSSDDIVRKSLTRFYHLKAFCSPNYIIYHCSFFDIVADPILLAFKLVQAMEECKKDEIHFAQEYEGLIKETQAFARDLLAQCRNNDEVKLLLQQREGYTDTGKSLETLPRLTLAVQFGHKEFATHSHAQRALYVEWTKNYPQWRKLNDLQRFGIFIIHLVAWPFYFVPFICLDARDNSSFVSSPVARFLNYMASYVLFLVFLLVKASMNYDLHNKSAYREDVGMIVVECAIGAFVIGHMISTIKQLFFMPRRFLSNGWNVYDIVTQLVFIATFTFSIISSFRDKAKYEVDHSELGARHAWKAHEPLLIAEAFYSIAIILSFGRVLRIFQLHPRLGPLQAALAYMFTKAWIVLSLMFLVLVTFSTALSTMYRPYDNWNQTKPDKSVEKQHEGLTSQLRAIETLYWGLFALSTYDNPVIIERNVTEYRQYGGRIYKGFHVHNFEYNEFTGSTIFGLFHVLAYIALMNTVIALMTGAGAVVLKDVDSEWKYARTQIWIFYSRDTKLPSPLNIFEPLLLFCSLKRQSQDQKQESKVSYLGLVKKLLQRYLHRQAEASLADKATIDEVYGLRGTVADIKDKYEALHPIRYKRLSLQDNKLDQTKLRKNEFQIPETGQRRGSVS